MGGLAHSNHGVVGSIHPNIRSDEAEEKSAGEGRRSPDGPMPPSGASVTKVFPARPTGANFTDEPAGGADEEDGGEGDEAGDVAIGGEGHHAIALFGVTNGGEKALLKGCDHDPDVRDDLRGDEKKDSPEKGPPTIPGRFFRRGRGWRGSPGCDLRWLGGIRFHDRGESSVEAGEWNREC